MWCALRYEISEMKYVKFTDNLNYINEYVSSYNKEIDRNSHYSKARNYLYSSMQARINQTYTNYCIYLIN